MGLSYQVVECKVSRVMQGERGTCAMGSGTNLVDAEETTECIVEDASQGRLAPGAQSSSLSAALARRGTQVGSNPNVIRELLKMVCCSMALW